MANIRKRNKSYEITVSCGYGIDGRQIRRTKGFPGERLGSRAVRPAEPPAFPAVLHKGRQRGRAPQYGASRPPSIKETMLP